MEGLWVHGVKGIPTQENMRGCPSSETSDKQQVKFVGRLDFRGSRKCMSGFYAGTEEERERCLGPRGVGAPSGTLKGIKNKKKVWLIGMHFLFGLPALILTSALPGCLIRESLWVCVNEDLHPVFLKRMGSLNFVASHTEGENFVL